MRTLVLLILAGWLALTVSTAEANFGLGAHGGPGAGTSQLISSVPLTGNSFTAGSSPGTGVGTIGTPVMSPSSPAFSGSCCTLSGTDAASFMVVGSTLETVGVLCASSPPCTYHINLVAIQGGISNSPFAQAETITANAQTIASVPLSNNTFTPGSGSGTVVGTIGTPVMSPTLPAFSGSCCTLSGTDAASFQIVGGNLETNGTPCPSGPCSFSINLVATQAGASNSPFPQPETITAGTVTNVISVQLSNENLPVSAASSTVIGALSAKVTGGGACTTCTFSMVNAGVSSDGITCSTPSNDFQVVTSGPDPVDLANLNVINTAQIYGQAGPASPTHSYICVKATPAIGTSFTQPFSIMVRNPTFTAFAPLTVPYTTATAGTTLATLSTNICWTDCGGVGSPPAVTYTLGGDTACSDLTISGASLKVGGSTYSATGVCHITATAGGVGTGMIGTSGSSYVAAVYLEPAPYVGPGDATYRNSATGLSWTTWTGPYAISAAYATAGSPVMTVLREGDQQQFTINALPSGDMDYATLAADCDTSVCYGVLLYDQSGHSPGCTVTVSTANCLPTWNAHTGGGTVPRRPMVYFDAFNGAAMSWTNSNQTDRFWWNSATYGGSGATGTLWIDAYENNSAFGGSVIEMAATGTGSNPTVQLQFVGSPANTGAILYVGSNNHTTAVSQMAAAAAPSILHSMIGVVNGASSVLNVDGVETVVTAGTLASPVSGSTSGTLTVATTLPTGIYSVTDNLSQLTSQALVTMTNGSTAITFGASQTLSSGDVLTMGSLLTASFVEPLAFGGGFGGGSDEGFIPGPAAIATTLATSLQRQALACFDYQHYGIGTPC